jgi:hypothetical protein
VERGALVEQRGLDRSFPPMLTDAPMIPWISWRARPNCSRFAYSERRAKIAIARAGAAAQRGNLGLTAQEQAKEKEVALVEKD